MKKQIVLLMCTLLLCGLLVGCTDGSGTRKSGELSIGDQAPDFATITNAGQLFTLSEQNKVVLLNFWATWCGPCVGEMPAFERLQKEYGNKIAILAVNCMEGKETVDTFIYNNQYTFPISYDEDGVVNEKYPSEGIPYTIVIGADGIVKQVYMGATDAETQYQEYKKAIDQALGE